MKINRILQILMIITIPFILTQVDEKSTLEKGVVRANASKLGKKHASHNERRGALWKKVHSQSYSAV